MEEQFYGHKDFYKLTEEEKKLHSDKNYQYATKDDPLGNFNRTAQLTSKLFKNGINKPLAVAMVLMAKQIDAVYDIIGEDKQNTLETIEDKFKDISVYAKLCTILYREGKK